MEDEHKDAKVGQWYVRKEGVNKIGIWVAGKRYQLKAIEPHRRRHYSWRFMNLEGNLMWSNPKGWRSASVTISNTGRRN